MIRIPCTLRRPDGLAVAQFALDPDLGILLREQIDGERITRLIGPVTAQRHVRDLIADGWQLIREGQP